MSTETYPDQETSSDTSWYLTTTAPSKELGLQTRQGLEGSKTESKEVGLKG